LLGVRIGDFLPEFTYFVSGAMDGFVEELLDWPLKILPSGIFPYGGVSL